VYVSATESDQAPLRLPKAAPDLLISLFDLPERADLGSWGETHADIAWKLRILAQGGRDLRQDYAAVAAALRNGAAASRSTVVPCEGMSR
jgi:hypothetical protein